MGRLKRRIHTFAAAVLDVPEDVVHDLPRITMIGNRQLYIENHRGVLNFTPTELHLDLTAGQLRIEGKELVIRAILPEEVFIEGTIQTIHYEPR
ncbi:sporulation protein YqfC [Gorillibacterium timonense]|uniref:sporulation protein YqfC n=1 Tax=Gorillibacterium timonense TaxID=1689269 RepID=UPI00071D2F11|nr:sporulation protein YqfC [Gorillibacterium timonense]